MYITTKNHSEGEPDTIQITDQRKRIQSYGGYGLNGCILESSLSIADPPAPPEGPQDT